MSAAAAAAVKSYACGKGAVAATWSFPGMPAREEVMGRMCCDELAVRLMPMLVDGGSDAADVTMGGGGSSGWSAMAKPHCCYLEMSIESVALCVMRYCIQIQNRFIFFRL